MDGSAATVEVSILKEHADKVMASFAISAAGYRKKNRNLEKNQQKATEIKNTETWRNTNKNKEFRRIEQKRGSKTNVPMFCLFFFHFSPVFCISGVFYSVAGRCGRKATICLSQHDMTAPHSLRRGSQSSRRNCGGLFCPQTGHGPACPMPWREE